MLFLIFGMMLGGAVAIIIGITRANEIKNRQNQMIYAQNQQQLLRQLEILKDCEDLVNNSENLDTVAHRYDLLLEKLTFFLPYTEQQLSGYGIHFGKPVGAIMNEVSLNKTTIFCQAIDRAHEKWIRHAEEMKTQSGKERSLQTFKENQLQVIENRNLPAECRYHLDALCMASLSDINEGRL